MLIKFSDIVKKYKPHGVVHIGAHMGEEVPDYFTEGVTNLVLIEAIEEKAKYLKETLKEHESVTVIHACLSDIEEEITFNITNNGQSSSMLELGTHRQEHPDVYVVEYRKMKTKRYIDLNLPYHSLACDFLNMDIQGAELKALKGMGELLQNFNAIYTEVNVKELYRGCALLPELESFLNENGFVLEEKQVSGAGWGDALFIRK